MSTKKMITFKVPEKTCAKWGSISSSPPSFLTTSLSYVPAMSNWWLRLVVFFPTKSHLERDSHLGRCLYPSTTRSELPTGLPPPIDRFLFSCSLGAGFGDQCYRKICPCFNLFKSKILGAYNYRCDYICIITVWFFLDINTHFSNMSGSTKAQTSTKTFKSKADQVLSFEPNKNAQDVDAFPAETSTVTLPTESSSMEPSIDPSVRILPILTLLMDAIFHR